MDSEALVLTRDVTDQRGRDAEEPGLLNEGVESALQPRLADGA